MSAEQRTSSVGSPWEEIGYDAEEKLSGTKRARVFGKNGKNKKREELRDSAPVGVRSVVVSEPKLSSPNLTQANSEPGPETKVSDVESSTPSTFEPALNNAGDVEAEKKEGNRGAVGSPVSRKRRNPKSGMGRIKLQGEKEETLPVLTVPEEIPEVKEEKAEETRDGASNLEISEVPGNTLEAAGKTGVLKEDDIVEGFGAVSEKVPEIGHEEIMGLESKAASLERMEKNGEKESGLEGEYLSEGEESLQELRERIKTLKHSADESRNRFLALRHRNTSKWLAIKKALFSLRPKEPPEPMVNELNVLKSDWMYKLTLYKDAVVELAKREVAQRELGGKPQGELMAEAIRGLDLQGSIENYDAWKNASWGDRKDSGFLRTLGRARDWAEQYRKLDWKKRVAISAAVVGTGVVGVAVGSAGLVGLGVAGSTLVRLLGAYGAGRGSYEFLEGRAAQKTLQYHEVALSHVEKIEDIGFLEQRMKSYADRTQQDLERAIAGNRKRVIASVALGSALFLGGTAFAHRGAIQEFSGKISSEFSKFLEQAKIIAGLEDFHAAPVSITGAANQVVETTKAMSASSLEGVSPPANAPLSAETAVSAPPTIEPSGFVSDADVSGMGTDRSVAANIVGEIGKNISETSVVPEGSSFERVLIEKLTGSGIPKEEAGKLADQAMRDFAEKAGKPFEIFNHIRPGAEIQYEIGSDGSLHVFGVTRKAGGEVIKRVAESVSGETPSPASVVQESIPLQSKPFDIPNASSPIKTLPLASFPKIPEVALESPQDILDRRLPNIPVPSLEDTLKGNVSPSVSIPAQLLEGISANASVPTPDFESLNLAVPGSEYLKNVGTIVKERLTFLPLSQTQKDLIENIFSARIPTANTEPTASSILFVRDTLGKALFSSDDVARWMQDDIEHVQEKVNKAVYAGLVRVGGESLRIGKMIAEGETVESWLTKMARHILMHRIGHAQ